jgi:ribosome-binding factor A
MSESPRQRRVAERVQQVVARLIGGRIKDPRLGFTTITEVRVTGDLHHATIFYTVLGDEAERAATAAALDSARGLIRSEVGKALGLRLTPSIDFQLDRLPEGVHRVEDALREAAQRDAAVARLAAGADYAGEADPYKHPADADPVSDAVPDPPAPAEDQPADGTRPPAAP